MQTEARNGELSENVLNLFCLKTKMNLFCLKTKNKLYLTLEGCYLSMGSQKEKLKKIYDHILIIHIFN